MARPSSPAGGTWPWTWFAGLQAPSKALITFDGAAHSVAFEQADAVDRLLIERILPETYRR